MERAKEYQFRNLPSDFKAHLAIDSEPKRKSEANLVYKIPEKLFRGINGKLRVRKRAKEFINMRSGKLFAVVSVNDENQECLYFGEISLRVEEDYPKKQIKPILYLTRCVGSKTSKKHWSKVYNYIMSHYEEIYNLRDNDILSLIYKG